MTHDYGNVVNIYTVYEIRKNYDTSSCPTLENGLFGAVTLTKNADIDKYNYSDVIGFDRKGIFSRPSGGTGKNVIIFRVDMGSFSKINNEKIYILILGKGPTEG